MLKNFPKNMFQVLNNVYCSYSAQKTALLLKSSEATQESCDHSDPTSNQQQVGSWEWWEWQGKRGKFCLREGQPDPNAE